MTTHIRARLDAVLAALVGAAAAIRAPARPIGERTLVVRSTSLGDFTVFLPFFASVQQRYGTDMVDLLIISRTGDIVCQVLGKTDIPYALIDPRTRSSLFTSIMDARSRLSTRGYRRVLYAAHNSDAPSGRLKKLLMIRMAVGLRPAVIGLAPHREILSRAQLASGVVALATNQAFSPFVATGLTLVPAREDAASLIQLTSDEVAAARRHLRALNVGAGGTFCSLYVHAKDQRKRWSLNSYTRLLSELLRAYPTDAFCLVGGKQDHAASERVAANFARDRVTNLAGVLSVRETFALQSLCTYFIGNDGAPAHLAALAGCRVISLFCEWESAGLWEPIRAPASVSLRPAGRYTEHAERQAGSVNDITVDDILDARRVTIHLAGHAIWRVTRDNKTVTTRLSSPFITPVAL